MNIDKKKFWWGMVGLIIVVLAGVNIHLYLLRKSIVEFIKYEAELGNRRIEQIRGFR